MSAVKLFAPSGAAATENSVDVSWTAAAPGSFAAYELHVSTSPGFVPSASTLHGSAITNPNQTQSRITGLKCGTAYTLRIRTTSRDGRSLDSDPVTATTLPCSLSDSLIVGAGGNFETVESAVTAFYKASDGKTRTIFIRPGRHAISNTLRLGRSIRIVGSGPRSEIILDAAVGQCIIVEGSDVFLKGLTLRATSTALSVEGEAVAEDCEFTSTGQTAVGIYGNGNATLRRCSVSRCTSKGVVAWQGGRGRLEGCTISENQSAGVEVRDQARLSLSGTEVANNRGSGVLVNGGGTLELTDCRVLSNALEGISVKGGTLMLKGGRVSQNRQFGLNCSGTPGSITLENTDLSGNTLGSIRPACQPTRVGTVKE
jgi:hypothetical protein